MRRLQRENFGSVDNYYSVRHRCKLFETDFGGKQRAFKNFCVGDLLNDVVFFCSYKNYDSHAIVIWLKPVCVISNAALDCCG